MIQSSGKKNVSAGEEEPGGGGGDFIANNLNPQNMESIQQHQNSSYNGTQSQQQQQQQSTNSSKNVRKKAYVKITEQPASKALRFRYECEGRSAGSIPGVNSTPENKTYPTIEIVGYKGRAVVVVSCVTKDQPFRPHPHNLVGKEGCKKGVCTVEINPETMRAVFSNLGIQCVKKKDIEAALKAREEIRVDPFKTGFTHRFQPSSIDLNSVRLCFQVFMESEQKGRFTQPLAPVVSDPIYDKKAMSDLVICRLCSCSASVLGNTQIILLCEKVAKDDISVRFFEEKNGQTIWEAFGEFQHTDVHKQTAIAFKTPRYRKLEITEPAKVFIQLRRPSDGVTSEALPFEYVPLDSDPAHLKRKRQKTNGDPVHMLLQQQQQRQQQTDHHDRQTKSNCWNAANVPAIKMEPREASPQHFSMYRVPPELTPSPQPLSPPGSYPQNAPSPYNVNLATATHSRQQMISPNQQYNAANAGDGSVAAPRMETTDYNSFSSQTQHHYQGNQFGGAGAAQWQSKQAAAAGNNNLNNINSSTTFTMHNILEPGNLPGAPVNVPLSNGWNLSSSHFPAHQLQQPYPSHQTQTEIVAASNNGNISNTAATAQNVNNGNNANQSEHGLSNLLTIDSEQYVRINSEDQQMLRLNSEDLQISNLSIST